MGGNFHYGCFGNDWFYHSSAFVNAIEAAFFENKKMKSVFIKIGAIIALILIVYIVVAAGMEAQRKRQIQSEIEKLAADAEKIRKENFDIQDKIAYLESRDYQEKEAKDKLSLQGPDEKVIIIKPGISGVKKQIENTEMPEERSETPKVANYYKWWLYFFK